MFEMSTAYCEEKIRKDGARLCENYAEKKAEPSARRMERGLVQTLIAFACPPAPRNSDPEKATPRLGFPTAWGLPRLLPGIPDAAAEERIECGQREASNIACGEDSAEIDIL